MAKAVLMDEVQVSVFAPAGLPPAYRPIRRAVAGVGFLARVRQAARAEVGGDDTRRATSFVRRNCWAAAERASATAATAHAAAGSSTTRADHARATGADHARAAGADHARAAHRSSPAATDDLPVAADAHTGAGGIVVVAATIARAIAAAGATRHGDHGNHEN